MLETKLKNEFGINPTDRLPSNFGNQFTVGDLLDITSKRGTQNNIVDMLSLGEDSNIGNGDKKSSALFLLGGIMDRLHFERVV